MGRIKKVILSEKEFNELESKLMKAFKELKKQAKKNKQRAEKFWYVPLNEEQAKFLKRREKKNGRRKKSRTKRSA